MRVGGLGNGEWPTIRIQGSPAPSLPRWSEGRSKRRHGWGRGLASEPGREIGVAVDRVVGEEDIVIKSIAENYKNIHRIAGASILGDGRVSLILDTAALIDAVSQDQTAVAS